MLARGVYLPCSQFEAAFVSAAHTDDDIDRTIEAARGPSTGPELNRAARRTFSLQVSVSLHPYAQAEDDPVSWKSDESNAVTAGTISSTPFAPSRYALNAHHPLRRASICRRRRSFSSARRC